MVDASGGRAGAADAPTQHERGASDDDGTHRAPWHCPCVGAGAACFPLSVFLGVPSPSPAPTRDRRPAAEVTAAVPATGLLAADVPIPYK